MKRSTDCSRTAGRRHQSSAGSCSEPKKSPIDPELITSREEEYSLKAHSPLLVIVCVRQAGTITKVELAHVTESDGVRVAGGFPRKITSANSTRRVLAVRSLSGAAVASQSEVRSSNSEVRNRKNRKFVLMDSDRHGYLPT